MKKLVFWCSVLALSSMACSKPEPAPVSEPQLMQVKYDTTAIDSFSPGAISVDVAEQIRMSSQKYQDSLKAAVKLQNEEKKLRDELEKEKKKEEERKTNAAGNATQDNSNSN